MVEAVSRLDLLPIDQDDFLLIVAEDAGPAATFKQDLPVMVAMASSVKENTALIQEKTRQNIDNQNRNFAAIQQANHEVQESFSGYLKTVQGGSVITSRSADDFSEVTRGYRTVEDTTTGERTSADLGRVDDIVDNLNKYDPDRYKQIPLRDEADPLPPPGR